MNLQKKIFVLMLSVGVAAFIFMGIVAITGMYMVNNKINNAGQQMSENTSGFTEQFAETRSKRAFLSRQWKRRSWYSKNWKTPWKTWCTWPTS
jgi:hypothetical protein